MLAWLSSEMVLCFYRCLLLAELDTIILSYWSVSDSLGEAHSNYS